MGGNTIQQGYFGTGEPCRTVTARTSGTSRMPGRACTQPRLQRNSARSKQKAGRQVARTCASANASSSWQSCCWSVMSNCCSAPDAACMQRSRGRKALQGKW